MVVLGSGQPLFLKDYLAHRATITTIQEALAQGGTVLLLGYTGGWVCRGGGGLRYVEGGPQLGGWWGRPGWVTVSFSFLCSDLLLCVCMCVCKCAYDG